MLKRESGFYIRGMFITAFCESRAIWPYPLECDIYIADWFPKEPGRFGCNCYPSHAPHTDFECKSQGKYLPMTKPARGYRREVFARH